MPSRKLSKSNDALLDASAGPKCSKFKMGVRSERRRKRPVPEDEKDDHYYQQRQRNNLAAKKSRDARKLYEEHILRRSRELEEEKEALEVIVREQRDEINKLSSECEQLRQRCGDQ